MTEHLASAHGFLLQPTYRIEAGRAVVHLFGVLEDGQTFLVRDDRTKPRFYVRASDREAAARIGAAPLAATGKRTLRGEPVLRVEVAVPPDTPALRDRLIRAGIPCFEADVRFALRYLMDRGVRGSLEIVGRPRPGRHPDRAHGVDWVFTNPEVRPSDFVPELRVLAFDIETDRDGKVLAISLHGMGAAEVLLHPPGGAASAPGVLPDWVVCKASERELLAAFVDRVMRLDPDVLTGWNVIQFDLTHLVRRAQELGVPFEIGRSRGPVRIDAQSTRAGARATIAGRMVLDGPQVLRGAFIKMEEYSLDTVARAVLGEGKVLAGTDRVEQIWESYAHDLPRFCEYSLVDSRLVVEILDRLQLVELSVERSRLTGLPLDRVHASVAAFDFLYLSELGKRDRVGPTVAGAERQPVMAGGGHVLESMPGLHRNVMAFDFQSLYPSLIRTFQIDPLGQILAPSPEAVDDDPIRAPNGALFRRQPGILTQLLDPLFERREQAKRSGDRVASQAIKILMNSFYGVLGTSVCRFARGDLATAITSFGREILLWTKAEVEARGYRVLYGDTDSLFVAADCDDPERARRLGEHLAQELNLALARYVAREWRVESRLVLEFERLYVRLLFPEVRHGRGGARKRYAGLVEEGGVESVVFVGLEVVRSDWTDLAHRVQRELYERLFKDDPEGVEELLRATVAQLREGQLDELLVYHKGLGKELADYTETTPPHVAAARKSSQPPGRRVAYVWTQGGPEPAGEQRSPLDYGHYVDKQIRPVAEPVLAVLGLDFDEAMGAPRQLKLF